MVESGNFIYKIISAYFLMEYEYKKDPEYKTFFDKHHPIPRAVEKVINKMIENGELSPDQLEMLSRIDCELTKEVPLLCHRNFNEIFRGDCLITQVIDRLDGKIFNGNRHITNSGEKEKILRFMFYVSLYNRKSIDPDYISREVAKKYAWIPKEIAELFDVDYQDVMRYLEDYFFYPQYEKYWDLWEFLEKKVHPRPVSFVQAAADNAVCVS